MHLVVLQFEIMRFAWRTVLLKNDLELEIPFLLRLE